MVDRRLDPGCWIWRWQWILVCIHLILLYNTHPSADRTFTILPNCLNDNPGGRREGKEEYRGQKDIKKSLNHVPKIFSSRFWSKPNNNDGDDNKKRSQDLGDYLRQSLDLICHLISHTDSHLDPLNHASSDLEGERDTTEERERVCHQRSGDRRRAILVPTFSTAHEVWSRI